MSEARPVVDLQDLLDFAYCPLRVWWRGNTAALAAAGPRKPARSGEQLVQAAIQQALFVYYKYHVGQRLTLPGALGLVWKALLARWELRDLDPLLAQYAGRRAALLERFARGDAVRPDGTRYQRPTWTRQWAKLAETMGLTQLQQAIDARQAQAGLGSLPWAEEDPARRPLGLAETFARTQEITAKLALPDADQVVGVGVPVAVELLACQLHLRADLVRDLGEEHPPGRPASVAGVRRRKKYAFELHLYADDLPHPASLARDLRVLALAQAVIPGDAGRVAEITVRHLPSGACQSFYPKPGDGLDVLEALAASVQQSIRAGAFVPRMVCGWRACGDCDYRPACFAEEGVLQAVNPPRMAQIQAAPEVFQALGQIRAGADPATVARLEQLLAFLEAHPICTPQAALRILQAAGAEEGS